MKRVNPSSGVEVSPRDRAILLVADAIGELMGFWNFKPSMGRIWSILYLSPEPLDAEEIEGRSGLSAGMVSITLQELQQWGVVKRVLAAGGRRRVYAAETDIVALVARVFRERELRLVQRTVDTLEQALALLEADRSSSPQQMLDNRFLVTRVRMLLDLARTGQRVVDRLARTGTASLRPIRDVLAMWRA